MTVQNPGENVVGVVLCLLLLAYLLVALILPERF